MQSQEPAIAPSHAGSLHMGYSAAWQLGVAACYATRCCIFHASTSPARLHRDETIVGAHAGYRGVAQRPQGKACHPTVNGLVAMRLARAATCAGVPMVADFSVFRQTLSVGRPTATTDREEHEAPTLVSATDATSIRRNIPSVRRCHRLQRIPMP